MNDQTKEVIETILERKSVRTGFSQKEIPDHIIKQIVKCGLSAPSAKNSQPWRFHVVTDRNLLSQIASQVREADDSGNYRPRDPKTGHPREEYASSVLVSVEILESVTLAIFVESTGPYTSSRVDVAKAVETIPDILTEFSLEYVGLGAAIENMWLAATAHKLFGTFLVDVLISEGDIKARLGISGDLVGVLALGYLKTTPPTRRSLVTFHDPE